MKKKTIISTVSIVVLLGAMTWVLASNKKEIDSHKEAKTTASEIAVTLAQVEMKATSNNLRMVGTAQPAKDVNIASESAGKITRIYFKMGDYVAQGKVLAEIDDTYKRLAYENAKLNFDKYKEDIARYEVLRKGEAVSETQYRDIKLAYENASIQLQNAKKQWDDCKVTAPFSGYITSKNVEQGAFVNAGTIIAGISDINELKVVLEVSETDAYQLKDGQPVEVTSDVQSSTTFNGKIRTISQKATASHTYPVEVMIANNGKNKLKAGTYVNVIINTSNDGEALMIPRNAIISSVKDPSVYVVNNNVARMVKINTGRSFDTDIEVLGGISRGDKVVVDGQINLSDGAKVSVIN